MNNFFLSVIIPIYNSEKTISKSLSSIVNSLYKNFEVIVVDDCSRDNSLKIIEKFNCTIIKLKEHKGDAFARNCGAKRAIGDILVFIDSDIVIQENTLTLINESFIKFPEMDALVGLYTKFTPSKNFSSIYKNLLHHFTHQQESKFFPTFWTGCGAIKKDIFWQLKGFNPIYSPIADIHLGIVLNKKKFKVYINKELLVTHLKEYTLFSLLIDDLFHRAIPWTHIMLAERKLVKGLNTKTSNILSVILVYLIIILLLNLKLLIIIPLVTSFILLNYKFYLFIFKETNFFTMIKSIFLNFVSYFFQGLGVFLGSIRYLKSKNFLRL